MGFPDTCGSAPGARRSRVPSTRCGRGSATCPRFPLRPELLGRIREATAAFTPARSLFSRLKTPLETAAAVLLLVSAYWYWTGSPDTTATRPAVPAAPPVEIASPASPPAAPPAPVQVARATPRTVAAPRPARTGRRRNPRTASRRDRSLPFRRTPRTRKSASIPCPISPPRPCFAPARCSDGSPPSSQADAPSAESGSAGPAETPETEPSRPSSRPPRLRPPFPYGRDVSLEMARGGPRRDGRADRGRPRGALVGPWKGRTASFPKARWPSGCFCRSARRRRSSTTWAGSGRSRRKECPRGASSPRGRPRERSPTP